jgi:hypothetical protein
LRFLGCYTNIRTYSDFFRPCQVCYFLLCFGYISTKKKKKRNTLSTPFFSCFHDTIPTRYHHKEKFKKLKIGVGLFPTYYGEGKGQPFAGATHCTVLHCSASRKQKTHIKTRGKQQSSKLIAAATPACSFQSISYNTAIFTHLGFYREKQIFAVARQCTFVPSHLTPVQLLIV